MTDVFDGVMVCTGHHTEEYWPQPFPGQGDFTGKIIHSHDYKDYKVGLAQTKVSLISYLIFKTLIELFNIVVYRMFHSVFFI